MSNCIRPHTKAATYFFTLRLADRHSELLTREIDQLRRATRQTLERFAFHIDAITVLPAAIHMIWTLPQGDDAYPARIAMLKSRFSRAMPLPAHRTLTQIKRAEKGIWQRRYWEHQITNAADFARHRDMIYLSPVQAGLVATPQQWRHTSLHRDLEKGLPLPVALGGDAGSLPLDARQDVGRQTLAGPIGEPAGLSLLEG